MTQSRISAAGNRYIDRLAVLTQLFDAPIAGVLAVAKHLGAKIIWAWAAAHRDFLALSYFRTPLRVNSLPNAGSQLLIKRLIYRSCTLTYPTTLPRSRGCCATQSTATATRCRPGSPS